MIFLAVALVASLDSGVVRHIEVAPGEFLHTTVIGSGEPVVLIPGIFGGAYGYRKITAPLVRRGYQCIIVEPLGYGRSSHPAKADYSFTAQTKRVEQALTKLDISDALFIANSTGASIAMRLAVANPKMVRGILSISGGPAESAATPGMKKAFRMGGFITKLAVNEGKLRHDVRKEIVKNSGDTTWVTPRLIREYTAGQAADVDGSIDAFRSMSKSKETESLQNRLDDIQVPVRLLVGGIDHPSGVKADERELLAERIPDFALDTVAGSGQYVHEEQPQVVI
ncbi:MAG TPA: alpha/beta hydrolase, partial [Gemmatimonadales bacterium]|nr:alpha/beta hydrolase [Gemmatimonadales bacterium]